VPKNEARDVTVLNCGWQDGIGMMQNAQLARNNRL